MSDGYACKECGAAVTLTEGGPVRSCPHTGTIIATMKATAHGEGGASDSTAVDRIFALIAKVLRQLGVR